MRQRNFVPIYAPGVTPGISRKRKEEAGGIGDNRLINRPVKLTWSRLLLANILNHTPKSCRREGLFSFSWIFSSGGGAPLPAEILAGQRRGRAPMSYDSFYPTFRLRAQARNGLGHELRRGYSAAMSRL